MEKLTVKNLEKGDILVFKGERNEWISEAIMLLTDSDVSHAALYLGNEALADEGLAGLGEHKIVDSTKGYSVYVNRRTEKNDHSLDQVVAEARKYLNDNEPYSKSNLVMLAMILLYKKFTPPSAAKKIIIKILLKAAGTIIEQVDKRKYPGKTPMMCSQFVYQCYENCNYSLGIKNGTILSTVPRHFSINPSKNEAAAGNHLKSILNNVIEQYSANTITDAVTLHKSFQEEDENALAQALVKQLRHQTDVQAFTSVGEDDHNLQSAAIELCKSLAIYHNAGSSSTEKMVQFANQHLSYFVTPADLKSNCINVKNAGTVCFDRI